MQLPKEILEKAILLAENFSTKELSQKFKEVSERYCGEKVGKSLLNQEQEATAYALSRMPATYAAVFSAVSQMLATITREIEIKTLLDIGAGTGAATLAVAEQIPLEKIICFEREEAMINLGKNLLNASEKKVVREAKWKKQDMMLSRNSEKTSILVGEENEKSERISQMKDEILETADMIVVSYMLNELEESKRLHLVEKLWKQTKQILLIVDPGTPKDFQNMMQIKKFLLEKGAKLIAPCSSREDSNFVTPCSSREDSNFVTPCSSREDSSFMAQSSNLKGCSLPKEDWCHFLCRVERTKWQKEIKDATVPYEDEKFTYLAFSKQEIGKTYNRVIRPPVYKTNFIEVKLCEDGQVVEKIITKKEKELYKKAKKVKVGESLSEEK